MRYQKWLSKIIIFTFTLILTLVWVLLPKVVAQQIYYPPRITQNHLNPQNLLEKGKRLYQTKKFNDAISVLKQAAQIFQNQGNQIKTAIALTNISLAYKQIGKYQLALSYINQSRELLENQPNLKDSKQKLKIFAQVLDIGANLQLKLAKPITALDSWKGVTAIYSKLNLEHEKFRSLINQSLALQALGRYHQAVKILEKLVTELHRQPNSVLNASALRSLGDVKLYLGETDNCIKILKQSYKIAQQIKDASQISQTLLSLGNAQRLIANKARSRLEDITNFAKTTPLIYTNKPISPKVKKLSQQALQNYNQSIAISTSPTIKIKAQLNKLEILIELQEYSKASKLSSELKLVLDKFPESDTLINARINLVEDLFVLKQLNLSNASNWEDIVRILAVTIKQAQNLESTRAQAYGMGVLGSIYLLTKNLTEAQEVTQKALNLALRIEAQDIAYLWQWQLGYIFKVQKNITAAIDFYSQAVNNLNDLRGDLLILNPDMRYSFRDNVEPVYRQLVDLLLQPGNFDHINQQKSTQVQLNQTYLNQKNLKQSRDVIEALQLREIENYFQETCLQAKPEIIDTVVDETDTTAAVIYPIILQNRLEVILKLPLQKEFHRYTTFIKANDVEKILDKLQYSLRQPEQINQVNQFASEVYNWLIKPLETDLQNHQIATLVFVLDGTLRNIPMAVLYNNKAQEKEPKYLIEKYAIVLTPGLQMLDPKPLIKTEINLLAAGVSEKRLIANQQFNPLQNVPIELQTIKSQIPESEKLLNQSFTDIILEKQIDSAKYTIVHIATHGKFSSSFEDTYILAWNKLLKVKEFDKLFQVSTNTDSKAIQLLVLSACETANGDKRAALGLSGVAVRAGARSTLATLWAIEDKSTAQLMSQFYRQLQNNKLNKAKALQQAQINLLRNNEIPLIWAPYVLVGNWL